MRGIDPSSATLHVWRNVSAYPDYVADLERRRGGASVVFEGRFREEDKAEVYASWKKLVGGAPVTLRLHGRGVQGYAEPVAEDKQAVASGLEAHLRKVPSDGKYYHVTFDEQGNPRPDEVEKATQTAVMVRINLH